MVWEYGKVSPLPDLHFFQTIYPRLCISPFFTKLFIYLLAALSLHCCKWAFSCCSKCRGGRTLYLQGMGFSLWRILLLWSMSSWHVGFSSCGTRAALPCGMWKFPWPGTEPISPALAGRLLTTGPPRKSNISPFFFFFFFLQSSVFLWVSSSLSAHTYQSPVP